MNKWRFPSHYVVIVTILLSILYVSGSRIRFEKMPSALPRVLSLFTEVPEGFVKVVDTIDGDTITVLIDGKEQTVRLLGVDTPETKDPRRGVQCFGHAASEFTRSLLQGKAVRLLADPFETDRDDYGRLLRYVYLEDGSLVNETLVEQGYAFAYEKYPTVRTESLKLLEAKAKEQQRGLWGGCQVTIKNNGKQKSTQAEEK